jgi:hypothetical protein
MSERGSMLPPADDQLWELVEACVTAGPAWARDQLEARLRGDAAARRFYVAYLDLHAALQWRTRGESASPRRRPAYRFVPLLYGAAACLVLAAGVLVALVPRRGVEEGETPDLPAAPRGAVAVLIGHPQAVWEADMAQPTESGTPLQPGRLKLRAGVVELAFCSGGEVLVEGPAELDVCAADRAYLRRGKLTAKVAEGAPAFHVEMPGVAVTDRGGECGLWCADARAAEVHVFAGQVDADTSERPGTPAQRVPERGAARFNAGRQELTPVPLNEDAFAQLRPEVRVIDASVRGGQFAGRNFGIAPHLMVKHSIPDFTWESYLCFDLAGIKGRLSKARVRLMPVQAGMRLVNAAALVADRPWGETSLTWDSRPAAGPTLATWTPEPGQPVEFDVTGPAQDALAGEKRLVLRLFAPQLKRGNSFVQYGSRRGAPDARPQLLLAIEPGNHEVPPP